jgi:hypothetical protein
MLPTGSVRLQCCILLDTLTDTDEAYEAFYYLFKLVLILWMAIPQTR